MSYRCSKMITYNFEITFETSKNESRTGYGVFQFFAAFGQITPPYDALKKWDKNQ